MARKKKVATLKKRLKSKPLAYVDKKGNVRHFKRGQKKSKHAVLQKKVVDKDLLKKRRAKGKKGILLYVKGKGVYSVARKHRKKRKKARSRRRKVRRKRSKLTRKSARKRRRRRGRTKARRRKSSRCPKTRGSRSHRAAKRCIRAGKGRTIAKRRVFNLAVRRLRKTKSGRAWLRKNKIKMAKTPSRKKRRTRRKAKRRTRRKAKRRTRRKARRR